MTECRCVAVMLDCGMSFAYKIAGARSSSSVADRASPAAAQRAGCGQSRFAIRGGRADRAHRREHDTAVSRLRSIAGHAPVRHDRGMQQCNSDPGLLSDRGGETVGHGQGAPLPAREFCGADGIRTCRSNGRPLLLQGTQRFLTHEGRWSPMGAGCSDQRTKEVRRTK